MMRGQLRLAALAVLCVSFCFGCGRTAAHPMGNFSINHYAALTFAGNHVQILFLLDMAEIPTFQELSETAALHLANASEGAVSHLPPQARAAYLAAKAGTLAGNLRVTVDGRPLRLQLQASALTFPSGAGGLPTERVYLALDALLPTAGQPQIAYQDANYPDRAGWKEIVGQATAGARLQSASAPTRDRSRALTVYPVHATSSPPQDLAATFSLLPGPASAAYDGRAWGRRAILALQAGQGSASAAATSGTSPSWTQQRVDALTVLIARKEITAGVLLLSLLAALGLGALHALSPGHGKTMVAAYLVGNRGTSKQAVLLGVTVTITHTIGVFALGLVTLFATNYIVPDKLYPVLGCVSGLLIAAMGAGMFVYRLKVWRAASGHPRASFVRSLPSAAGVAPGTTETNSSQRMGTDAASGPSSAAIRAVRGALDGRA